MVSLSIVIITYNEEKNLARCLQSISEVANEIIVVDSFSTDSTRAIASSFGAKVVEQRFEGYAQQKNHGIAIAANDWILSLDADEALSPELSLQIRKIKSAPAFGVYQMPRLTNYCGKWIRHCGWYPDRQTRLFDRTKGKWAEQKVHEYWQTHDKTAKKGLIEADLLHYSFSSISEHIKKIEKYTELAAQDAAMKGKNAGILKIVVSPAWHFFSEYFLKLGFLDGYYGYIICRLSAYSTLIKYARIRQRYQQNRG